MNTFVYHDGALGDVLLSLPCLARIKAGSSLVHLAGRHDVVRFLRDAGVVDRSASSDGALFASLYSTIDSRLRDFLSPFDRAVVFTADDRSGAAAAIRTVIPRTSSVRTVPPEGSGMHAAGYRLSQLAPDVSFSVGGAILRLPPERLRAAHALLLEKGRRPGTALLAVHPGSGGRPKCWPLERYFEVIECLQSRGDVVAVLFTGDAEDEGLRKAVGSFARGRDGVLHASGLDLLNAAALLWHCGLYLGNDSGFSHLAGLLGCVTIALFGPTDPRVWRPLGPRVEVVSTGVPGPMTEIPADEVIAKAEAAIA